METKGFKPVSRVGGPLYEVDVELDSVGNSDVFKTPSGANGVINLSFHPGAAGEGGAEVTMASEERIDASVDGSDLEWIPVPDDAAATNWTSTTTQRIAGATAIRFNVTAAPNPVRYQVTGG